MHPDHFIGGVAIALGACGLWAAIGNHDGWYRFQKTRWLEERLGRRGARCVLAALGLALVALGCCVALGLAPGREAARASPRRAVGAARV